MAAIAVVVAVRITTTATTTAVAAAAAATTTTVIETVRRVGRWRTPYVLLVRVFVRERGWSVARVVVSKMKSDSKPLLTAQAEKANHYT